MGEDNKYGRRNHVRVSVVPPAAGILRMLRAVDVESENQSEFLVISHVAGVIGEELALEVGDRIHTHMLRATVADSRIAVVDGAVQYRLRVRAAAPPSTASHSPIMDDAAAAIDRVGFLVRDIRVRLLDCSPAGGLFEASQHVEVGSVGSVRLIVHNRQIVAHIIVARSQTLVGTGARWRIGCRFLWFGFPSEGLLRRTLSEPTPPGTDAELSGQP